MKDPGTAIPKGTLWAILSTYITYIIYGVVVGFTYTTQASGVAEEFAIWNNDTIPLEEKMMVRDGRKKYFIYYLLGLGS